jgi:hypothetical protein
MKNIITINFNGTMQQELSGNMTTKVSTLQEHGMTSRGFFVGS